MLLEAPNRDRLINHRKRVHRIISIDWDVIPLIGLLQELRPILSFEYKSPTVHCTIFEDNRGCIDLVTTPKIRPRTKHIALKYHHFRSFVRDKTISIKHVDTKLQIADIFTKAVNDAQFIVLRTMLMSEG